MDKSLIISKTGQNISVRLMHGPTLMDEVVFPLDPAVGDKCKKAVRKLVPNAGVDIHFDTMLIRSIDKILKRNRIEKVSPLESTLEGFGDESSMSFLIARSVLEALKIK